VIGQFIFSQVPDYDINSITSENEISLFFKMISVQTSHHAVYPYEENFRTQIGILGLSRATQNNNDLSMVSGKGGIFPVIELGYWATSNLQFMGTYSSFVNNDDIVFSTSYGFKVFSNLKDDTSSPWMFSFQKRTIEGQDDFLLKSLDAGVLKQINVSKFYTWLGAGITIFDVKKIMSENNSIPSKLSGQVNTIRFGVGSRLRNFYGFNVGFRVHSKIVSGYVGFHRFL